MKTQSEFRAHLVDVMEETGLDTMEEAADYVLLHYNMYDYSGKDKEFIDFCDTVSQGGLNEDS